ncbi:hypothetical protein [Bauldia sp.]|uniref:hypothetical protein n=1 Tax=Bauldia sp. TaxID=2575872 RepID=UPI003BAA2F0F
MAMLTDGMNLFPFVVSLHAPERARHGWAVLETAKCFAMGGVEGEAKLKRPEND